MAKKEETLAEKRQAQQIADASFKLNLSNDPDAFLSLLSGNKKTQPLPGESSKITAKISSDFQSMGVKKKMFKESDTDMDSDSDESINDYQIKQAESQLFNKYGQILKTLNKFDFAEDQNEFQKEIELIDNSVRKAIQSLKLQKVANNTKRSFKDYASKFYYIPGGIKTIFAFGKYSVEVVAIGSFNGDEVICIDSNNGKIASSIKKIVNQKTFDISDEFSLNAKVIK